MSIVLRVLAPLALLGSSLATEAARMDITAEYSPSMDNPENTTFKNTTPQSGYCAIWPHYCQKDAYTIRLPLTTTLKRPIIANDIPRNNPYFLLPNKKRTVIVTNESTGEKATVFFRVSKFSVRYSKGTNRDDWQGGNFLHPNSPCSHAAVLVGNAQWHYFLWNVSSTEGACYKVSTINRSEPSVFNDMSVEYELTTPDPHTMSSGRYEGTLPLRVGPGGDVDFGDNYQASDGILDIHFILSVNHELKVTPLAGEQQVALQACTAARICTEEEGKANWERWMITRIPPQLTGRSRFHLSSSGSFTVYLQCERQSGANCALKNDNGSQLVPVQTLLTLPDNIVDDKTGSTVSRRQLMIGKEVSRNVFKTKLFYHNKQGSIDFLVRQQDVDTMLSARPATYRGAVTVIFDPEIY